MKTVIRLTDTGSASLHIPSKVYINGKEVMVKEGSLDVSVSGGSPTAVTLTIFPDELVMDHAPSPEEEVKQAVEDLFRIDRRRSGPYL